MDSNDGLVGGLPLESLEVIGLNSVCGVLVNEESSEVEGLVDIDLVFLLCELKVLAVGLGEGDEVNGGVERVVVNVDRNAA